MYPSTSVVKFGEIPFRPEERAEASGPEGDGEGLSSSSYWPPCAASEEVGQDSSRTCLGSLGQRPLRWGAVGEGRTTPWLGAIAGGRERVVSRADSRPMAWHPGPPATYVQSARRVFTRSDRHNPCRLRRPVGRTCGSCATVQAGFHKPNPRGPLFRELLWQVASVT